ncbi:MAG: hypothetical protein MZU95_09215 [Desulfomicrobium escambiense]|nr:hypothetical protein [Desulfomicrobium escambiense]
MPVRMCAFGGPMVVSMRPIPADLVEKAAAVTRPVPPQGPRRAGARRRSGLPGHPGHSESRLPGTPRRSAPGRSRSSGPAGSPPQMALKTSPAGYRHHPRPRPHVHNGYPGQGPGVDRETGPIGERKP